MNAPSIPWEVGMATNVVNLDALIPREDFAVDAGQSTTSKLQKIDIHHLDDHFFVGALRKPDFQRETAYWTPEKVADLVRVFVDGELVPAVILWQAGKDVFVIDGAHRLSALLAWVKDDYGDGVQSLEFFQNQIPDEQKRAADRTRLLVHGEVGPYAQYVAGRKNPANLAQKTQGRLSRLATDSLDAQWVPAVDAKGAEDSFFKINEAATPIDSTERRILKSRDSANAIAARAIVRSGTGNKYWGGFRADLQVEIEKIGTYIYQALYQPPIGEMPIKTLDLPVAGRGYNALPFVFDLVNISNGLAIPDAVRKNSPITTYPADKTGDETLAFLKMVRASIDRITGDQPSSLGIHPVVYFYGRTGIFQPAAFLATAKFLSELDREKRLKEFTSIRSKFENILIENPQFISLITHKFGSGGRGLNRYQRLFTMLMTSLLDGNNEETTLEIVREDADFSILVSPKPPAVDVPGPSKAFPRGVKSQAFLRDALPTALRCHLCNSLLHKNSMHADHVQRVSQGGGAHAGNAKMAHPFCDSIKN